MPPRDMHLIAPTGTLVARESTHPALIQLFVQAAQQVHGGAGWFQRKGDFPNARNTERPLASEAERFYRNGVPFLQRYLPFWLANLIDRMWLVLVSIVAVLIPLSRMLPPLLRVPHPLARLPLVRPAARDRERRRLAHRSAELLARELDGIESSIVERIAVPLSYADELYALRSHIQLVRRRLQGA